MKITDHLNYYTTTIELDDGRWMHLKDKRHDLKEFKKTIKRDTKNFKKGILYELRFD